MLACGVTTPATLRKLNPIPAPVPSSDYPEMTVAAYQLRVRDNPAGTELKHYYLLQGDVVTVYRVVMVGDYNWCKITPGETERWVGCDWLKGK